MVRSSPTVAARGTRHGLTVVLQTADGATLGHEPVRAADLVDAVGEGWLEGRLRQGRPASTLDELRPRLAPLFSGAGAPWCRGFTIEVEGAAGAPVVLPFAVTALEGVAWRGAERLRVTGVLRAGERYLYRLQAEPLAGRAAAPGPSFPWDPFARPGAPAGREGAGAGAVSCVRPLAAGPAPALPHRVLRLAPLLAAARAVDEPVEGELPLLVTAGARVAAERLAREGASRAPAVESGGVLVGILGSCPDSGELFVVVHDALPARDTEGSRFSLAFGGATWAAIEALLRARRRVLARAADRLVGSVHGHPFKLGGDEPACADCAGATRCSRSSAYLSDDDRRWSRAVFSGTPWQVAVVHGTDALDRPTAALYGQRGGRLVRRGFHELPDEAWRAAP